MIVVILQLLLVHGYFYTDDNLTDTQQVWIALLLATPLLRSWATSRLSGRGETHCDLRLGWGQQLFSWR